jgi:hypothetical protein
MGGKALHILGVVVLPFAIRQHAITTRFVIISGMSTPVIIGNDTLSQFSTLGMDFKASTVTLGDVTTPFYLVSDHHYTLYAVKMTVMLAQHATLVQCHVGGGLRPWGDVATALVSPPEQLLSTMDAVDGMVAAWSLVIPWHDQGSFHTWIPVANPYNMPITVPNRSVVAMAEVYKDPVVLSTGAVWPGVEKPAPLHMSPWTVDPAAAGALDKAAVEEMVCQADGDQQSEQL